ncbi:MAG: hypothetical protein AAGF71_08110 [Pseudomonadota bacterium]
MPVAIVTNTEGWTMYVVSGTSDRDVLLGLVGVPGVPELISEVQARLWLLDLPLPSGWYYNHDEAHARLQQIKRNDPMEGGELAAIRSQVAQTRAEFALAIGFKGSANTRHKQIWEMENGRKPIMPERARAARMLLATVRLGAKQG